MQKHAQKPSRGNKMYGKITQRCKWENIKGTLGAKLIQRVLASAGPEWAEHDRTFCFGFDSSLCHAPPPNNLHRLTNTACISFAKSVVSIGQF